MEVSVHCLKVCHGSILLSNKTCLCLTTSTNMCTAWMVIKLTSVEFKYDTRYCCGPKVINDVPGLAGNHSDPGLSFVKPSSSWGYLKVSAICREKIRLPQNETYCPNEA